MIPVFQTVIDKGRGNCFSAALASILEFKLEEVPYFRIMGEKEWIFELFDFLHLNNCEWYGSKYGTDILNYNVGIDGYYIVNGRSRFYVDDPTIHHSVVFFNGKMVHDPNPCSKGLFTIESCYMIEKRRDLI